MIIGFKNPQITQTSPAGSNTQIQFNNNGVFGASANLVFDAIQGFLDIGPGIGGEKLRVVGGINLADEIGLETTQDNRIVTYTPNTGFEFGDSASGQVAFTTAWITREMKLWGPLNVHTSDTVSGYVDAQAVVSNPTGAGVFRFEGQGYAKFEFKAIHASGTGIDSGAYQLYSRNDGSNPPVLHLGALNDAENSESPILEVFRTGTSVTDFHIYPNTSVDGNFTQVSISADTSGTVYLGDPQGIYNGTTFTVSDTNQWAVFDGQKVGIGLNPTALLNIKAGTTASGTAPLKFSSGSLMTSPEIGAVEYLTDLLYLTRTTGTGRLAVLASQTNRLTAKTAAQASVVTFTPPADGSFIVSANILVTTATLHNFTATVTYTDEGGTSRTVTLNFNNVAGTISPTIANAGGAIPYEGIPLHIRAKGSSAITIATTGTFTTVTYNVEGMITQIA